MQYLEDLQHYEDRYDLWTIEKCLGHIETLKRVVAKLDNAKELEHLSKEEQEHQMDMLASRILMNVMADRFKERDETLKKWIDEDRSKQDLQDTTLPPENITCDKCGGVLHDTMHHLH